MFTVKHNIVTASCNCCVIDKIGAEFYTDKDRQTDRQTDRPAETEAVSKPPLQFCKWGKNGAVPRTLHCVDH